MTVYLATIVPIEVAEPLVGLPDDEDTWGAEHHAAWERAVDKLQAEWPRLTRPNANRALIDAVETLQRDTQESLT